MQQRLISGWASVQFDQSLCCLHAKPTKWPVCPAKTQISLSILSVWSVFVVCMKKAWVLSLLFSAHQRLIRLGGRPCWSESLLGAQVILFCCDSIMTIFVWRKNILTKENQYSAQAKWLMLKLDHGLAGSNPLEEIPFSELKTKILNVWILQNVV